MDDQSLLNELDLALIVVNQGGQIHYVNEATERLFDTGRRRLCGLAMSQLLPANLNLLERIAKTSTDRSPVLCLEEELHLVQSQKSVSTNASLKPIVVSGEPMVLLEISLIGLAQKLEMESAATQRAEAAHQLIRNLSHEIKNPLGGIRGAAQLAQKQASKENIEEYTQIIIREVDRVNSLLVRMSAPNAMPNKQALRVDVLLANCLALIKSEYAEQIELHLDCDSSLPSVVADETQISQIVLNLLKNAAYFVSNQVHPRISVSTRLADGTERLYLKGKKGLRISVQDNGEGVSPAVQEQLFFPLVSDRKGGSGIGLSISQDIARNHGGIINYQNSEEGACFSLYLPFDGEQV